MRRYDQYEYHNYLILFNIICLYFRSMEYSLLATKLDPHLAEAHSNLANVYKEKGQHQFSS